MNCIASKLEMQQHNESPGSDEVLFILEKQICNIEYVDYTNIEYSNYSWINDEETVVFRRLIPNYLGEKDVIDVCFNLFTNSSFLDPDEIDYFIDTDTDVSDKRYIVIRLWWD